MLPPQVRDHCGEIRRLREDVRPEPAGAARGQLEHRPVPENRFVVRGTEHEPRTSDPRALLARPHLPAPPHPQVATEDEPALEAQEQVLAQRLHRLEPPSVEPLGEAPGRGLRMRRLDLHLLADQHLEPARRSVQSVPLGHAWPP